MHDDSQLSTRALIARGRAGDRSALDRVFGRVTARLRKWAHGRMPRTTQSAAETNDVIQDAALGLWNRLQTLDTLDFQRSGDLDAYMRQAVLNRIRDHARRGVSRPLILPMDQTDSQAAVDASPSALDLVLDVEAMDRYQRAFAALEMSDREALIARAEMGYSFEQIAQLTHRPSAAAARMAVNRAVERLRRAVDGNDA